MKIIRHDDPGTVRLGIHGELDLATAPLLSEHVAAALAAPPPDRLIVDVAGLTFCDSAGIDALLGARASALEWEAAFQVVGARGIVRRSMVATGVVDLLTSA